MTWPHFTKGQGILTAQVLNDLFAEIAAWQAVRPSIESMAKRESEPWVQHGIPVLITCCQAIGTEVNRWEYGWWEAIWDESAAKFIIKPHPRLSSSDGTDVFAYPAYNGVESSNEPTGVLSGGVDIDGADYPAGFALVPIRAGQNSHANVNQAPPAWMHFLRSDEGQLVRVFFLMNQHDGECST